MNLVCSTGQAWSNPNQAGVCAAAEPESADGKSCVGITPKGPTPRARLASQDVVLTIGAPSNPGYCVMNPTPVACCPALADGSVRVDASHRAVQVPQRPQDPDEMGLPVKPNKTRVAVWGRARAGDDRRVAPRRLARARARGRRSRARPRPRLVRPKPEKYTDYVQAFYASRYAQTAVFQKASAYDYHIELAQFRRDGKKLALTFPQTGKSAEVTSRSAPATICRPSISASTSATTPGAAPGATTG